MKYGLITMVALLMLLCSGCRSSTTAQVQAPLVEPPEDIWTAEEIAGFMATKDRQDTDADPPPPPSELDAMLAYLVYCRHYYRWVLTGAQLSGGRPDHLPAPEELWTNEQINRLSETLYRIQVGDQPPPTLAEIDAMQEYFDYHDMYNEWLLQQGGD